MLLGAPPRLGRLAVTGMQAQRVLLDETEKLCCRLSAEFGPGSEIDQRRKTRCAQRYSQYDAVIATHKDMCDLLSSPRNRLDAEPSSKQWLARIGHFNPFDASIRWVVEVGINKWCRLTEFNMTS